MGSAAVSNVSSAPPFGADHQPAQHRPEHGAEAADAERPGDTRRADAGRVDHSRQRVDAGLAADDEGAAEEHHDRQRHRVTVNAADQRDCDRRATVADRQHARAAEAMDVSIGYLNFKDTVSEHDGHDVYKEIWFAMRERQETRARSLKL